MLHSKSKLSCHTDPLGRRHAEHGNAVDGGRLSGKRLNSVIIASFKAVTSRAL